MRSIKRDIGQLGRREYDVLIVGGGIFGAVLVEETGAMAVSAGLANIVLMPKADYVDTILEGQDPLYREFREHLSQGALLSDYMTSIYIKAHKPGKKSSGRT